MKMGMRDKQTGDYKVLPHVKKSLTERELEIIAGSLSYLDGKDVKFSFKHTPCDNIVHVIASRLPPIPVDDGQDVNEWLSDNYGYLADDTWKGADNSMTFTGARVPDGEESRYEMDLDYLGMRTRRPGSEKWGPLQEPIKREN